MASQTGSLSLKMNRLTCHHRGPGWAARDEQLLLQRNHQPTLSTAHAGAPCTRCTPQLALCTVTYCTHEVSGSQGLACWDDRSSPSLPSSEACKLPRKKKKQTATAERASALNTVPIFQVCQRMQFDPGLDVHARLAFFVWQMRRTSRAVPWIFNKSTYTTGYNGSGSAYSPRFHRTMFGVLSHCLRLTVSSGTLEWIIRFGLEFPPEMAWPNKSRIPCCIGFLMTKLLVSPFFFQVSWCVRCSKQCVAKLYNNNFFISLIQSSLYVFLYFSGAFTFLYFLSSCHLVQSHCVLGHHTVQIHAHTTIHQQKL